MLRNILISHTQLTKKRRRWEKKVSLYVNFGWERRTASAGWCLLWSPLAQRKRTGALQITLSVKSCVNPSVLRGAFIIFLGVPPSVRISAFRWASCPPLVYPSSVGRSAFCRALRLPLGIPPSIEFSIRISVICWASCPPSSDLRIVSSTRRQGTPSTIWGMCPPNADVVLTQVIWGLCSTSADRILCQAI